MIVAKCIDEFMKTDIKPNAFNVRGMCAYNRFLRDLIRTYSGMVYTLYGFASHILANLENSQKIYDRFTEPVKVI